MPVVSLRFALGTAHSNYILDGLKSLDIYLKTNNPKDFRPTFRKKTCKDVHYFPDASFTSLDVSRLIFESNQAQTLCEYHRKGKANTFKADTVTELWSMGFKGKSVSTATEVTPPQEGHLHCGCPIREVAMEFFLWKTTCGLSSNPGLAGWIYAMKELAKQKPSTRSFWNKSIRNYTGLQAEDLISPDYGSDLFELCITLIQLHTQIQRLRILDAPVVVHVLFPDADNGNIEAAMVEYGIEAEVITKAVQLEKYWKELNAKRSVIPLPLITPTRKD